MSMGFAAGHGVRHRQRCNEEHASHGGQQESLNMPERRRRKEHGEPVLEHPHPSQQRRLETRTTIRGLCDLEQQLSVCRRVAEAHHDAIVTIHLDGEAQPPQLPP